MQKADVKDVLTALGSVNAVRTADLDKLQLENEPDEHSLNLPAIYMSWATTWQKPTGLTQRGETTVTLRVATEHYLDTHSHSARFAEAMDEVFEVPEAAIVEMEKCGFVLSSDEIDPLFTNIKVHRYTFTAPVSRTKTSPTVRQPASLVTEGNILPD